jgi:hypothetical protein
MQNAPQGNGPLELDAAAGGLSAGMSSGNPGRVRRIALIVAVLAVALLAAAWLRGGRQPLHEIVVPVAVPESAK